MVLITLFVLIGVIFGYFHFKSDDQENLSQYKTIVGTIKNVGDETLLIETNDHQKYLISIAGAIGFLIKVLSKEIEYIFTMKEH